MTTQKKIDVTVKKGTVNDGNKDYTVGDVLKMNIDEVDSLVESGVIVKGVVKPEEVVASDDNNEDGTG